MKTGSTTEAVPAKKFQLVGGELCLDFCNTVGGKRGARVREYLNFYADFVSWCEQAGLLDLPGTRALMRKAARHPVGAATTLSRAVGLREAIYRIFLALAENKTPRPSDLELLNAELAGALGRLRVRADKTGFAWKWANDEAAFDHPLGPIARSAANLLTRGELLHHVSH
jgi:predicted RNA-binding Zn ribbon-like protein